MPAGLEALGMYFSWWSYKLRVTCPFHSSDGEAQSFLAQGHTASPWWSQAVAPRSLALEPVLSTEVQILPQRKYDDP